MISPEEMLKQEVIASACMLYGDAAATLPVKIDQTPGEFEGELTVVIFPFVKLSRKNPELTGQEIGNALLSRSKDFRSFNVVKGFLNIVFTDAFWLQIFNTIQSNPHFGTLSSGKKNIVLEYCGPNTNKPLHLGHIRNVLLGYSMANILEAAGHSVHKVNILNDRGIAICKSMVAYRRKGNNSTPATSGIKGDHFVGHYYVEYAKIFDAEVKNLTDAGESKEIAEKKAQVYLEAVDMLQKWEAGDPEILSLWNTMNNWVYAGFAETYAAIGIDFEKEYRESEYYLHGREMVMEGLKKDIFFKKDDGSIWVDLTNEGLDQKVLLRADGTSVYITQDIGVARARYNDFKMDTSVYVVANEQDYHFKVLKLVLQKLHEPYADGIYHLNYGMVDLPEGKMKSREGNVVDADELIAEMKEEAAAFLNASDKSADFSAEEKNKLAQQIGLAALKYFMLKVDPKKRMLFNPKESIDLQGNTGPFIQYTYARIRSVLQKYRQLPGEKPKITFTSLLPAEKDLVVLMHQFPAVIQTAAENYSPADIANYIYALAKKFNTFYAEYSILKAESMEKLHLRAEIAAHISSILKKGLQLLGMETPEKM